MRSTSRAQIASPRPEPGAAALAGMRRHGSKIRPRLVGRERFPLATISFQPSLQRSERALDEAAVPRPVLEGVREEVLGRRPPAAGSPRGSVGSLPTSQITAWLRIRGGRGPRARSPTHLPNLDGCSSSAVGRAGVDQEAVDHPWRARAAPRPIASSLAAQLGVERVTELLGDHDRAALGDDQRLGQPVRGGGREALHRAAVVAQILDERLELLDAALEPRGLAARIGRGAVLRGALVADGRDDLAAVAGRASSGRRTDRRARPHPQSRALGRLVAGQRVLDRDTHRRVVVRDHHAVQWVPISSPCALPERGFPGALEVREAPAGVQAEPQLAREPAERGLASLRVRY